MPIAAASIGQVYKAKLHDGRDVAVKVQYPGVAAAVRADMQNLGVILRLMKSVFPGLDVSAMARRDPRAHPRGARLRARGAEPEDARAHLQGPPVHRHPRRRHVALAREGRRQRVRRRAAGSRSSSSCPQEERDRIGEIIFRFYFGCMYRHRQFSGDPHPGNSLLLDDGRMAFLDFGLFKRIPKEIAESELRIGRAGIEGDGEALRAELVDAGFIADPERWDPQELLEQFRGLTWWYTTDDEVAARRPRSRRRSSST